MTGGLTAIAQLSQLRPLDPAPLFRDRATRVKVAAWRRIQWTGNISLNEETFSLGARIGHGYRCDQRLGVRMLGIKADLFRRSNFNQLS
jgi:hypothetical protein